MKYDRIDHKGYVFVLDGCCAFDYHTVGMSPSLYDDEGDWNVRETGLADSCWEALCTILCNAETRSILFSTTDREPEWRDFVSMCPHVQFVGEEKSRHGRYRVQLWIVNRLKRS